MSRSYDLAELQRLDDHCREAAAAIGLDVPEILFHLAPAERIYDIAARGLPGRYGHWRFGQDYEQLTVAHDHGRSRIYELVLNTDPYQAYLLQGNAWVAQLLVIAHVYGHCWFFEHNQHFAAVDRKFLARSRAAAERFEEYGRRFGGDAVDDLVDAATALSWHAPHGAPRVTPSAPTDSGCGSRAADAYDDLFPDERDARRRREQLEQAERAGRFPTEPDEDVLGFVLRHSRHLQDWQRDVLSVVRDEAAYFAPQRRTKIINEGFATWVHLRLVHAMQLPTADFVEFDRLNAGVVQPHPGGLNPYNLGLELWREVCRLHDEATPEERQRYPAAGHVDGAARVLELATVADDVSLVSEYLTAEVCRRCHLFVRDPEASPGRAAAAAITDADAEAVRTELIQQLRTLGVPRLLVTDADRFHAGALWLEHRHEGIGLDREYAVGTLPLVAGLWGASVYVASVENNGDGHRAVWYRCRPGQECATVLHEEPAAEP
ncbi:MAG: SpoVR family protein [Vicinamibacterales bacterium]